MRLRTCFRSAGRSDVAPRPQTPRFSEPAAHVLPLHDLLVDLPEAAADHSAEKVEKLQRGVRVHREDLVQRGAVDGGHGGVALMGFPVGGTRLSVSWCHLAREAGAVQ